MPAQGYLVAHAYTSDALVPVEDVTITVTQKTSGDIEELLYVRLTDESGKTDPVTISTPDLAASQTPNQGQPFSLINVTAEHPLYERILVENVQIFPDTVALQNLQLIPLDEAPDLWNQTERFDVPPQNL